MSRPAASLLTRLALWFALLALLVLGAVGYAMYSALVGQLDRRDDAALVQRVEQIRTLLRDQDILDLIHDKPELFANMLGNPESLLVLRYPGQVPLLEVNPARLVVPEIAPLPSNAQLDLSSVQRGQYLGTPLIMLSATAPMFDHQQQRRTLQITAGRLLLERSRMLERYRYQMMLVVLAAAVFAAGLAYWFARHGLQPLRWLATRTASIGIDNLSTRIDSASVPLELVALIEGFNAMLNRLEIGYAQLSQVSADMAHDLRTPIGNLMGQTEVALSQKRSVDYHEKLLGSNFEELQRLSTMIDNMLFLARAEHADHAIDRRRLELAPELERIAEYFEGLVEERGMRIAWHGAGWVWADAGLLRRALANLLANAVRYADRASTITISVTQAADGTSIAVQNIGPTIEAHHQARLFDRFYRAEASRYGASGSSGLGLSIVRSIMMLHQGRWAVSSHAGLTCFSLWFPAPADSKSD